MSAVQFDFIKDGCGGGIPCEQGATFSAQLVWEKENPAGSGTYVPVDITGYTAKMQVRKSEGSPVIIELSTTNLRITLGGSNGTIDLLIDAADTASLTKDKHKYDLFLTDTNGFSTKFVYGTFEVVGRITT